MKVLSCLPILLMITVSPGAIGITTQVMHKVLNAFHQAKWSPDMQINALVLLTPNECWGHSQLNCLDNIGNFRKNEILSLSSVKFFAASPAITADNQANNCSARNLFGQNQPQRNFLADTLGETFAKMRGRCTVFYTTNIQCLAGCFGQDDKDLMYLEKSLYGTSFDWLRYQPVNRYFVYSNVDCPGQSAGEPPRDPRNNATYALRANAAEIAQGFQHLVNQNIYNLGRYQVYRCGIDPQSTDLQPCRPCWYPDYCLEHEINQANERTRMG